MDESFNALLAVLHDEELIRLQRRLQKRSNHVLAKVLGDELIRRETLEKKARPSWMNQTYESKSSV
jgi:hypothetical protein